MNPPRSSSARKPDPGDPPRLERWEHAPVDGTPYFDEVLQVPQGKSHQIAVVELASIVSAICRESGLTFLSDNPIWYRDVDTDEQRVRYGDVVIARCDDVKRITAEDLLVVVEIVSTNDRRREIKDTTLQLVQNEYNLVPEFGLVFPDLEDKRSLVWHTLDANGRYSELALSPGSGIDVQGVPGLRLEVRPLHEWADGSKIDVIFNGERRLPLPQERERAEQERERAEQERERAEQERDRAEQERDRAEQERERAEQERERAERLAEKLRAAGIDPDS